MKKIATLIFLLLTLGSVMTWVSRKQALQNRDNSRGVLNAPQKSNNTGTTFVATQERKASVRTEQKEAFSLWKSGKVPDSDRLRWLEQHGEVPEGAGVDDWILAQKTSWWGDPLDAGLFWKDRAVWCDASAMSSARRHGRMWPPIPPMFSNVLNAAASDRIDWGMGALEGPNIRYAVFPQESTFWDHFIQSHPKPPEDLAARQFQVAEEVFSRRVFEKTRSPAPLAPQEIIRREEKAKKQATQLGYPAEAFSDQALFWSYIFKKREDFEKEGLRRQNARPVSITNFLNRVAVDPRLITEPITEEQVKSANAWKIAYLRRLRNEKVDESYINAYLEAWKLLPADVFLKTQRP